jgi:uncharacterized protein with von Willebrand factor type A (vWA) domain
MRSVEAALQRLAQKFGPDVLFLPVEIVDHKTCGFPVACIDAVGIKLTDKCVDEDTFNLEVYVAHEIMHEVVEDESILHVYRANTVNTAADYKINQYLGEFFGYDVQAVKFKGLRSIKYDALSIEQICALLPSKLPQHFNSHMRHPIVIKIAKQLRDALGIKALHPEILKFKYEDAYYSELRKHYPEFKFQNLPNINPDVVVRNLWVRHYQMSPRWIHSSFDRVLSHTQTLSIVPTLTKIDAFDDPEFAMFAAVHLVNTLNEANKIVEKRIIYIDRLISRAKERRIDLKQKLVTLRKKRKYSLSAQSELQDSIDRIPHRIKRLREKQSALEALPKLPDLLKAIPSVRVKRFDPKAGCLSSAINLVSDTPRYDRGHELIKLIRFILKNAGEFLADIEDLYANVKTFAKDFAPDDANDEADAEEKLPKSQKGEQDSDDQEDFENSEDDANSETTDSETEDGSEDTEKPSKGKQSAGSDAAPNDDEDIDVDALGGGDMPDEDSPSQGTGRGSGGKLVTLNTLASNPKIFKAILKSAHDFGAKLIVKPSFKPNDEGMIDRTLTFGTDLTRLPASELGRLGSDFARLSFLVDLANGNLLQYTDLDPRRGPIVLMLDCSGSMGGSYYEMAAGFCLSMIHKLYLSKRGIALIKFSGGVDSIHVWEKGQRVPTLAELAQALSTPSGGGTDFDDALQAFFDVCLKYGWLNAQGLLVSDGYGTISEATKAKKPPGVKTTAVLVSNKKHLPWVDECVNVTRKNMELELVRVGNSMM